MNQPENSINEVSNQSNAERSKNRLGIVCAVAVIAVLASTLWPFNPFPSNRVRWLPQANGVVFDGGGLVISKEPLRAAATGDRQGCTLELLLRPAAVASLETILGFYATDNPRKFLVQQWTDSLLVRHDVVDAGGSLHRTEFDVDHVFEVGRLLVLTIVSGSNGTVVYTNGQQVQAFHRVTISQNELSGQMVLGTSPVDYQPWSGEVRGLAIHSSEMTPSEVFQHYQSWSEKPGVDPSELGRTLALYFFTERAGRQIHNAVASGPALEIPKNFAVPHKALLASPKEEFAASWWYVRDLLLNVAGFVPLGFIVCAYFASTRSRGKAVFYTILAAGMLSFAIEVLQAYIPRRDSGMTDIITNTLGAAIGAALARPRVVRAMLEKTKWITRYGKSVSP